MSDPKKSPERPSRDEAEDAVRTLRLAREAGGWTLVKLEVLGEKKLLYPDMIETLRASADGQVRPSIGVAPPFLTARA